MSKTPVESSVSTPDAAAQEDVLHQDGSPIRVGDIFEHPDYVKALSMERWVVVRKLGLPAVMNSRNRHAVQVEKVRVSGNGVSPDKIVATSGRLTRVGVSRIAKWKRYTE